MRARKYRMYGVDAGMWYFAPASKSDSLRCTDGAIPWYFVRSAHHDSLYFAFGVLPEKTSQRHLSIMRPNGRKATLSSAIFIWTLMRTLSPFGTASRRPRPFRYSGVT